MDVRPIGVYDSGVGGISLWRAIRSSLPDESIIYLGDGKNCPYGEKSSSEIIDLSFKAVETLLSRGCKMIVIACNTATSTAIQALREAYPQIPFVGMEPAVKPACAQTKSGIVAVLATKRSLESDLFEDSVAKYSAGVEVIRQVGEGFVQIVEDGEEQSEKAFAMIKPIIDMIYEKGADKIVLGCTHYPFLMEPINRAIAGRKIDVIDPSEAIVRRIEKLMSQAEMAAPKGAEVKDEFISFANSDYVNKLINRAKWMIT
ncbi:MAG: glutamate racemase [Rikenellaceae bacterium]